ncbi:MAG: hypothetical protein HY721_31145 [Planctomycetes bacterium]|nr:hypothetical protein [Planctomycetota bacterium]
MTTKPAVRENHASPPSSEARLEGCAACTAKTVAVQRQSVLAAVRWLSQCAAASQDSRLPKPPPLSLARWEPDCVGLECEAPIRRDIPTRRATTPLVQEAASQGLLMDPQLRAALANLVLSWACRHVHLPRGTRFTLGPGAFHAALIANNLVQATAGGEAVPSVAAGNLRRATDASLLTLETLLQPGADDLSSQLTAGDLIVVRVLRLGVQRLVQEAHRYRRPEGLRPRMSRKVTLGGAAGLGLFLIVAGFVLESLLTGLLGLGLFGLCACLFSVSYGMLVGKPDESSWHEGLKHAVAAGEHVELLGRFTACDLLEHGSELFLGTTAKEPTTAVSLVRLLYGSPGGQVLLSWVAHKAAARAVAKKDGTRLAAVGEACLNRDFRSRGAHFASQLLIEVLDASREPRQRGRHPRSEEQSPLWELMAGGKEARGTSEPSLPRLLARILRRAAAIRESRGYFSHLEGDIHRRSVVLIDELLGRLPLKSLYWHLLLIRVLAQILENGAAGALFPSGCRTSFVSLCASVRDLYADYSRHERCEEEEQVREECRAAISTRGFLFPFEDAKESVPSGQAPSSLRESRSPRPRTDLDYLVTQPFLSLGGQHGARATAPKAGVAMERSVPEYPRRSGKRQASEERSCSAAGANASKSFDEEHEAKRERRRLRREQTKIRRRRKGS